MGCEGGRPTLERPVEYVRCHPEKLALAVSTEICSANWFPASEQDPEYVVSSAIFADASSCALVGYSDNSAYPEVLDFESCLDPDNVDLLGYQWLEGRLKVVLSVSVPEILPPLIRDAIRHAAST